MTTIAWDGRLVAAESQCNYGSQRSQHSSVKIRHEGDVVFAGCGARLLFPAMIQWWLDGHSPDTMPKEPGGEASTLLVFKGGKCHSYRTDMPYPDEFMAPEAWGSGQAYACVAMSMGADARRAVEEAIKFDTLSGGEILVVDIMAVTGLGAALLGYP